MKLRITLNTRPIEVTFKEASIIEEALYQYMKNNSTTWSEDEMEEYVVLKGYISYITNTLHRDESSTNR